MPPPLAASDSRYLPKLAARTQTKSDQSRAELQQSSVPPLPLAAMLQFWASALGAQAGAFQLAPVQPHSSIWPRSPHFNEAPESQAEFCGIDLSLVNRQLNTSPSLPYW